MRYSEFEKVLSATRMNRYLTACGGDTKKSMTLYRKNLRLSQGLFTIISCYEIALRNAIDRVCIANHGTDWLRTGAASGGIFDNVNCRHTQNLINKAIRKLGYRYSHPKLLAVLDFGFWRYLFAQPQFFASGQILLQAFPNKPTSTPSIQYNQTFVFNKLGHINDLRNRIAHHEPICFIAGQPVKDTTYTRDHYSLILQLFQWMDIDEGSLLYGLDHITSVCNEIDAL